MTVALALLLIPSLLCAGTPAQPDPRTDSLDRVIRREMARREIPGLSIAIIDSGRIVFARGYGATRRGGPPVSEATLFQAGSISKAVAATAAMRLVARGSLTLDRDINTQLVHWKLRDSAAAEGETVTVRQLLSHTAGLNVHGFPGYALTEPMPTAIDVLNGAPGTNTPAVRLEGRPGAAWRYSGGGYTVLQVLMSDVASQSFTELMQREVLTPAGMTASTYAQPLPPEFAPRAATGHLADGSAVPGGWHAYPEQAAAGLWTTASDLARFAIALQQAYRRQANTILPADVADQMLSYQRNDFMGLGLFLKGNNIRLEFSHGGRNEGFDASLSATARTRQGVAIMINANDNSGAVERIRSVVAALYGWPNDRRPPEPPRAAAVSHAQIDGVAGRYEVRNNQMLGFERHGDRLLTIADGRRDEEFVPVGRDVFTKSDGSVTIRFQRDRGGAVTGFESEDMGGRRMVPRVGPFATAFPARRDPDTARTARIERMLHAMETGTLAAHGALLSPGALRDFGSERVGDLAGLGAVRYLGEEDVSGRGIVRHDGAVARIVYLMAAIGAAQRCILVHLTSEGLLTDIDVVVR